MEGDGVPSEERVRSGNARLASRPYTADEVIGNAGKKPVKGKKKATSLKVDAGQRATGNVTSRAGVSFLRYS